ncbi:quinol:electron acceptor oxidoreductase subunit ActD [Haliangium ochraceum]|uniref:Cytochrome c domain-containing protein n=1 Tax=Haliangium ochraceum (strain DSM 14365 / JCM 11303 / SMP-2) TaxID=502025 RepID=D0LJA5_HALO1|nr:quinol:electron acceptor oxidoreductase subunit ActD [Haliangium ochraceum]ACY14952.1 hypothetical protein Hoch_2415 [Haliangium ochraceum DSM 14365]
MSENDKDKDKTELESEKTEHESELEPKAESEVEAEAKAEAAAADDAEEPGGTSQGGSPYGDPAYSEHDDVPVREPEAGEAAAAGAGDAGPGQPDEDEADGELYGLLAEFDSPGALIAAATKVRDAGYQNWDCYSPFPVHGLDPAMGIKRTILPWIVFAVGLCGLGGGLLLQFWTNAVDWPWIVSGKPFFSLPANIPITFEATILLSVFASFFGMWGLNKLPQPWHPFFKKERFLRATDDRFFIGIEAADKSFQRGKTQALLETSGALAVETCYVSRDPATRKVPRPVMAFIIISCVAALIPFALVAKARATHSSTPRVHVWSDMDFQPKGLTQTASVVFANGRTSRQPVAGTVALGQLDTDDLFFKGLANNAWSPVFPPQMPMNAATLERGRERFGIYCQPCHGASGDGNGMIHQRSLQLGRSVRGWVQPTNLHQSSVVRQPHGQLFNTITNGIRNMPGYAAQIPPADRWAIVLYVRALQRSQNASIDDVPADQRQQIR